MRLIEYDAKAVLARHGVAVPRSLLIESASPFAFGEPHCMLKAQMFDGGRAKAGLILKAGSSDGQPQLDQLRRRMRERNVFPLVLAEQLLRPEQEFYVAVRVDGAKQCASLMFGRQGGVDVEQAGPPLQILVDPLRGVHSHALLGPLKAAGFPAHALGPLSRFGARLYRIFAAEDAELIEINPLGLMDDGTLVALDCKMELDDSAAFRHGERASLRSAGLQNPRQTELERTAAAKHLTFVEMPGNVAVLTAGAGLGMAVIDALHDAGLSPANFVDAHAGQSLESKIDVVFERARDPGVKAIAIFLLQTANPLKRTMGRLFEILDQAPPPKPLAIGVLAAAGGERGMTCAEAIAELNRRGYQTAETFEALAQSVRRIVAGGAERGA